MTKKQKQMRKTALLVLSDLALNFVAYNRDEDEDLPSGSIEELVENNVLTVEEMTEQFGKALKKHLGV